jgi:hypothetical protein
VIKVKYIPMAFKVSSLENLKILMSGWVCESCRKSLTRDKISVVFTEQGFFSCPNCRHQLSIKTQNEIPFYAFNLDSIMAVDSIRLEREGGISILEKKWGWKSARVHLIMWLFLGALLALSIANFSLQFSTWPLEMVIIFLILLMAFIFFSFRFLQSALNVTKIMMKKDRLVVATLPLSFSSLHVILFDDILGFEYWKKVGDSLPLQFLFKFKIRLKDGRSLNLAPVANISEALYLEKTLMELILIERTAPPPVDEFVN